MVQFEGSRRLVAIDLSRFIDELPAGTKRTQGGISGYDIQDAINLFKRSLLNDKVSIFGTGHSHVPWHVYSKDPRTPSDLSLNGGLVDYHPIISNTHAAFILTYYEGRVSLTMYQTAGGIVTKILNKASIQNGKMNDPTPITPKIK